MEVFTSYTLASSSFRFGSKSVIVKAGSGGFNNDVSEFVIRMCQIGNYELRIDATSDRR